MNKGFVSIVNGLMWFIFPIALITLIATFQASSSVNELHQRFKDAPYITSRAELEALDQDTLVLVRGTVSQENLLYLEDDIDPEMIVFWEVPADGSKPTTEQADQKTFPDLLLTLTDGTLPIFPSSEGVVIEEEPASVRHGENKRVGFRRGDIAMIAGRTAEQNGAIVLEEATGITGETHEAFLERLEKPVQFFRLFQTIMWGVTIVSGIWFGLLVIQSKRQAPPTEEVKPDGLGEMI